MGIFKEDLINFGNLIDTEVEIKLSPEDFKREFGSDLDFEFTEGLMKIKGKRKVLFLNRGFEFRCRQMENKVYNVKRFETEDLGIYLHIVNPSGVEHLLGRRGIEKEGELLKMSLWGVLKGSEVYKRIPDAFRDRLLITRYKIRDRYLSAYVTVSK